MRYAIIHVTNPYWESGGIPSKELIGQVGALMGELAKAGVLRAGEGLRASALGARIRFSGGRRTITPGPFPVGDRLPAGFAVVRAASLDDAIEWATKLGKIRGDEEIDVRPVTDASDLGLGPPPADGMRRWMALQKATVAGDPIAVTPWQEEQVAKLVGEMTRAGVFVTLETLLPTAKGARLRKSASGATTVVDGPFAESKELIAGYVIVEVPSLQDAIGWARKYIEVVETDEVDVRLVAEPR